MSAESDMVSLVALFLRRHLTVMLTDTDTDTHSLTDEMEKVSTRAGFVCQVSQIKAPPKLQFTTYFKFKFLISFWLFLHKKSNVT